MIGRWVIAIVGGVWVVAAIMLYIWGSSMVAAATVDDVLEGFGIDDGGGMSSDNATTGAVLIWVGVIMLIFGVIVLLAGLVMGFRDRELGG